MKRILIILVSVSLLAGNLFAQEAEILTNSSILKMVRAKLSDELIIEVIKSSKVDFDLSDNAVADLSKQNVPENVIAVMKETGKDQQVSSMNIFAGSPAATPATAPAVQETSEPSGTRPPAAIEPPLKKSVNTGDEAIGYVIPVKNLIGFYESEFEKMTESISEWDAQVVSLINIVNRTAEQIKRTEDLIRDKKNADPGAFSEEIISLKKNLVQYREDYSDAKSELLKGGEKIADEIARAGDAAVKEFGNFYNDVSQDVKSSVADPALDPAAVQLVFKSLDEIKETTMYISPVCEMLVWYRNEIAETRSVIKKWNEKVSERVAADAQLKNELEPLEKKMQEYQSDPKTNKTEIAGLKKQISSVEKERKNLAGQMEDDNKELSAYLKELRGDIQKILEQRFTDIIENINYSFKEKITL